MTRSIWIPAGGCLIAFAALLATLQGAARLEVARDSSRPDARSLRAATLPPSQLEPDQLSSRQLSAGEAEQMLTALAGEYLRPWREWESSPRHLYSRVAPRPHPTSYANLEMPAPERHSDSFMVASFSVSKAGAPAQQVPCVVDRATGQVRLFEGGKWLPADEWVATSRP